MAKTILLIGTLDTKGAEYSYVRDLIVARGHHVLVIDASVYERTGSALAFEPDAAPVEVAQAGGGDLAALRSASDRNAALETMTAGTVAITRTWFAEGRFEGVLALGGSGGTALGTAAMRELPVGVPRVMVSTVGSGDTAPYVGGMDIVMLHSILDISGLNRISRRVLSNAVGAVCGMVEQPAPEADAGAERPLVAATMFGVTTPCVTRVRELLDAAGYEVLVFHATGSGGRAMEALIAGGLIAGVADVTTTEWADELVGGMLGAGPHRLEAAGALGIPQVVSVGAVDMVNFMGPFENIPATFKGRQFHIHNANITLMRTTPEENAAIGKVIADKLNSAKGPTTLLLPLKGVSMMATEGGPFYNADADAALFGAIRDNIGPSVELVELDLDINDPAFSDAVAERLIAAMK